MKELHLNGGLVALIDDCDWERVSQHRWFAKATEPRPYVCKTTPTPGGPKHMKLHRFIMDAKPGQVVDHANGDVLDNRRANLRVCTSSQNNMNRAAQGARKTSKFKGVSWYRAYDMWRVCIVVNRRQHHVGYFRSEVEAAAAYDAAAARLHGDFAKPNFARVA